MIKAIRNPFARKAPKSVHQQTDEILWAFEDMVTRLETVNDQAANEDQSVANLVSTLQDRRTQLGMLRERNSRVVSRIRELFE